MNKPINFKMYQCRRGPKDKVQAVVDYALENGITIVSWGLAPNPNGFCFELPEDASKTLGAIFQDMLNQLSAHHEARLRKIVF